MIFVAVAVSVASVVDLAARRTHQAARLRAESEILSFLAGSVLRGETTLDALLDRVRETFAMESVALLERRSDVEPWTCAGSVGPAPVDRPEDADVDMPVGDHMALALSGRVLPAEDRRVLGAFAAQAAVVLDRQRLVGEAEQARRLAEGNRIRTALLAAVSHDLRTPLAAIKAAVTSLRSDDVAWSEEDEAELLEGIEDGADRLDHLVGNLLDMSRLQTGTVTPLIREIDLDEVVPMALGGVPEGSVDLDIPETLPMVAVDPGLLERAVANIVENAVKYSPDGERVLVAASALGDRVEVRVVDRGPGVPDEAQGADLRTLPALRRRPARRRRGPRARRRPRLRRGHGRHPRRRGHPRRRPDHGPDAQGGAGIRSDRYRPARAGRLVIAAVIPVPLPQQFRTAERQVPMTRVLVVDDEPQIVRALVINLKARKYEVDAAPDGATALQLAAARHPDVVVLDLGLPDMDGVEVIKGLRGWTRVPILVLSARHTSDEKVEALDAGADDYVTKPFGMDELLARLRAAVRRAEPAGRTARTTRDRRDRGLHRRPGREEGPPRRTRRAAHPDRVAPAGGAGPQHAAGWSARSSCSRRSGGPRTAPRRTICGSTWPSCAASWRRTPRTRGTSSPSRAWGTASSG